MIGEDIMDERIKEIIAIGASVAAHCQPCLDYHLEKAKESGATEDDIKTAMKVGFMVEDGAGKFMRDYALDSKKEAGEDENPCCAPGCTCC
jgi:AhpD family alkylhydroperoxidase